MLSRRHLQLVAVILVAISAVAFTPRLQHPHVRLSCGSSDGPTLTGAQRFTDDSSRVPDLKAGYEVNVIPLLQDLKLIADDQALKPSLNSGFRRPFVRQVARRYKLFPARAESQDPL
jgi:hypothetical protein